MRKLSPTKAISHALNSVWSYRQVAVRIAFAWLPVLLLCGIAEVYLAPPAVAVDEIPSVPPVQIATFLISLVATSSMAVSWQRFILLDELGRGLRLDGSVIRYALYTLLLIAAAVVPTAILLALALLAPSASVLALPAVILIGGIVTRLSVRFPAIALGDRSFTFSDAWKASVGNFWQCLGVFMLSWAITLGGLFVLILISSGLGQLNPMLGDLAITVGVILMQLFYAIFNASVFTSLYGYFVEKREF
ncbi:hypothetical protein [Aestuariivirga sp.]|uniref:hypothetical protein n=1 Tax=Aestuariivirga sp. TaxID=2650926 RepID=UPI00301614BC